MDSHPETIPQYAQPVLTNRTVNTIHLLPSSSILANRTCNGARNTHPRRWTGHSPDQKIQRAIQRQHATVDITHASLRSGDSLQCQRDFGNVPVDVILTATYQVSADAFSRTKTEEFPDGIPPARIPEILNDAVKVAEEAKRKDAKVALSIGPYGAIMKPSQEYSGQYDSAHDSVNALQDWHTERMKLFTSITNMQSRLGYLSLETIPRTDEIKAMRKTLDATPQLAGIPFWMACVYPDDKMTLPSGGSVEEAVDAMLNPQFAQAIPWGWRQLYQRLEARCTSAQVRGDHCRHDAKRLRAGMAGVGTLPGRGKR